MKLYDIYYTLITTSGVIGNPLSMEARIEPEYAK